MQKNTLIKNEEEKVKMREKERFMLLILMIIQLEKFKIIFLNFLISLINDLATNVYKLKKEYFKKFDYKQKAKISNDYFKDLKNSTIENLIIKLNISEKYKCKNDIILIILLI